MITLKRVETIEDANLCHQLLILLAESDRKYDANINN